MIGICVAVAVAAQKAAATQSATSQVATLEGELDQARAVEGELVELRLEIRGRDEQLVAEKRIATEREGELARLRDENKQDREVITTQSDEIKELKGLIESFHKKQ